MVVVQQGVEQLPRMAALPHCRCCGCYFERMASERWATAERGQLLMEIVLVDPVEVPEVLEEDLVVDVLPCTLVVVVVPADDASSGPGRLLVVDHRTEVKLLLLQGASVVGAVAGAEDRPNEAAAVARTDVVVLQVVDRIAAEDEEEVVGSDEEVGPHVGDRVHQAGAYLRVEAAGQQRTEGEASYEVVVDVVPDVEGAEDDGKGVFGMPGEEHQEEGEGGVHKLPAAVVVDHQDHQQWSKAASRVVAVLHEKQQS